MKRTNLLLLAVCVIACFCAASVSALDNVQLMNFVGSCDVRVASGLNLIQDRLSGSSTTLSPAQTAAAKVNAAPAEQDPQELYELGLEASRAKDYETAFKYFQPAAEQGHAQGQAWLGWLYEHGHGVEQDDGESVKWYRLAADQGVAWAQDNLGWMYEKGRGVKQDDGESVKWYRLAAEQGYALAQNNLGACYYVGRGVKQNYEEAVKWYRLAAEQGNATAHYNLGRMYETGRGVEQDDAEAAKWYRLAAEQ